MTPEVSVIIAAYNSAARLMCAVDSVRLQDGVDFEIIVIGDASTDDSGEQLAALCDPRIRWENLPRNWGEQSVPSNRGLELARGDVVFFLNQDDLWMRGHATQCLDLLETSGADVVWSPYVIVPPGRQPGDSIGPSGSLEGIAPRHPAFDATVFIPASCTAWRREALTRLHGWRTADQSTVSPSQDLLWRARRAGMAMRGADRATVLVLWSGQRPGSFAMGYVPSDNLSWSRAIRDRPDLVDDEVSMASLARAAATSGSVGLRKLTRRRAARMVHRASESMGVHPLTFAIKRRYWGVGGFVNAARRTAGLESRDFRAAVEEVGR